MAPSRFWTYGRWQGGAAITPPWKGAPIQAIDAGLAGKALKLPRWGIPDSVVSQVLSVVATYAFIIAFYAVTPNKPLYNNALIFLSLFVQWIFMAGWPIVVSLWRGNGPRLDFGFSLSWRDFGPGALGAIVCLMGAAISAGITQAIFGDFGSNAGDAANDLSKYPGAQLAFLLLGVFAAPVLEELAFRGLLWGALAKRGLNPWWATTITAVAFAALHLEPVRFGVLLVAGMILGLMRQMTGRLGPSMLAHIGLNAIAFFGSGMILFS
jgi:membrane protease YdiL (CAAX protease family)